MKDTPTHRSENKKTMPNLMYSQNANELQKQRDTGKDANAEL